MALIFSATPFREIAVTNQASLRSNENLNKLHMNKEELMQSKWFKIILPIIILIIIIGVYRNGYAFGEWLYARLHP